jgi:hypothetical protein
MSNEDFSGKIENLLVELLEFATRLGRTFLTLVFKPGLLLEAVRSNFRNKRYLPPNTYLLSCAIALGFLGKILAQGFEKVGFGTLERINDLTLSSFLNHSVPVFGIAIAAAILVESLFRDQDVEKRRHFKNLNFYVIGSFGLGSIIVLLLLSGLLNLTFDQFARDTDLFVYGAFIAIAGYVTAVLGLLHWLTSRALRGESGVALPKKVMVRVLLVNLMIIILCALNFVSPLYEHEEGAPLLDGRIVELVELSDSNLKLTFLVENSGDIDIVLSRLDGVTVVAEQSDGERTEIPGQFCSGQGAGRPEIEFLVLASGKSAILAVCFDQQRLASFLEDAEYVDIDRIRGGNQLIPSGEKRLRFIVRVGIFIGDRRDGVQSIKLGSHR